MAKKKKDPGDAIRGLGGVSVLAVNEDDKEMHEFLKEILPEADMAILDEAGVYTTTKLDFEPHKEDELNNLIDRLEELDTKVQSYAAGNPQVVEVHSKPKAGSEVLASILELELRYIRTQFETCEVRKLLSDIYYDLASGNSITLLELNDMLNDTIGPSFARKVLLESDSENEYTTAQYLCVYAALRRLQVQYELELTRAKIDIFITLLTSLS